MLTVAIIGCGAMGKRHAEAYAAVSGAAVSAVVDPDEAKGAALAQSAGCRWVRDIRDLEADAPEIADICLPTHLHGETVDRISGFCRNIICEKPLVLEREELETIRGIVGRRGIRLMAAHVLRFWDCYVKARELVQSGVCGEVNSVVCMRRQKRPVWSSGDWLSDIRLSGGLVFDLIIHDLDYLVWLLGAPRAVFGSIVNASDGVPAHIKAELIYEGCTATVFGSWGMPAGYCGGGLGASLEIIGKRGMLYSDNTDRLLLTDTQGEHPIPFSTCDAYTAELQYFVDCCLQNREPDRANLEAVAPSLEIARQVNRSAKTGRVIELENL